MLEVPVFRMGWAVQGRLLPGLGIIPRDQHGKPFLRRGGQGVVLDERYSCFCQATLRLITSALNPRLSVKLFALWPAVDVSGNSGRRAGAWRELMQAGGLS